MMARPSVVKVLAVASCGLELAPGLALEVRLRRPDVRPDLSVGEAARRGRPSGDSPGRRTAAMKATIARSIANGPLCQDGPFRELPSMRSP